LSLISPPEGLERAQCDTRLTNLLSFLRDSFRIFFLLHAVFPSHYPSPISPKMRHPPATPIILATWITICATPARADHSAAVTCYAPDGKAASNDTIVPCNNLGITQSGVHSSCCQLLGDEDRRDLCTGTGLCLNNGIVRRGYCTDKTFDNPACVRVCETDDVCVTPSLSPCQKKSQTKGPGLTVV